MALRGSLAISLLIVSSVAYAQRFQCRNESAGVRNVAIQGKVMTVVNPKTPAIAFSKPAASETRGTITKTTTDAWELYAKEGVGQLTNITFGEKYTCIQTGS